MLETRKCDDNHYELFIVETQVVLARSLSPTVVRYLKGELEKEALVQTDPQRLAV